MGSLGGVSPRVITDQELQQLADGYGLPANKLKLCCFLIDCVYAQPELPKTQNIESKAKTALRKNPNDSEAQAILLEIERMRSTFSYNAITKTTTIYEHDTKKYSKVTKYKQNRAIWELVCLWEEHNGRIPSSDGKGAVRPLKFISTILHYLGDQDIPEDVHALRRRIDEIRKAPDGKTQPLRRNLYYSGYKPDVNNAAIRDEDGNIILPDRS